MNQNSMTGMEMPATEGARPIVGAVLAMAYVPMQEYGALYDESDGLEAGTLFPDLDKPFLRKKAFR